MSKDIDNEPILVEATTDLGPEYVAADSSTLNDCIAAFVVQMNSSPNTTVTDVQRSNICAEEVIDQTMMLYKKECSTL